MSFLTVPSQRGFFKTIKNDNDDRGDCHDDDDDEEEEEDDDDDDDDTDVSHLVPRSSPVLRKRGYSIQVETAEYLRLQQALSPGKRVAFADTTGGDLVDVKEFVAFDSDEEESSERWEEEEAKYRKRELEPTYRVQPEFHAPAGDALLQAVRAGKVEVEQISPLEDEPLAFSGLIRVLNISFQKAVYVRSTMDNWLSYYDHPAEYVRGSHDGATDRFSFKLSFAPPYTTHGSRIEFVVRYETANGDFWANNSSMNYVVTLLLTYEDNSAETNVNQQELRGILRPPKAYSMNEDGDPDKEQEKDEGETGTSESRLVQPIAVCPAIVEPEIDIEIADPPSGPSVPPNHELPSADGTPSPHTVSPGERFPCTSSETTLQINSSFVLRVSESVQPNKSQPLPRLHCELGNQTSEQPTERSPSVLLPSLQQKSKPRSDSSQAGGEEIPPPEASCMYPPTETNVWPAEEHTSTESPASSLRPEPAPASLSAPSVTRDVEQEVAPGLSELAAGPSEGFSRSAAHCENSSAPVLMSPAAETQGAKDEAPPSPDLPESTSVNTGVTVGSQNDAPHSTSAWEEKKEAAQISPHTLLENLSSTLPEASEPPSEHDVSRNLMPSIIFLSGVVSLSIVMQEPTALFVMGLLLVLHRL
ncbi:protein phosphatase 1 regulatory subunit 3F isoform X2 [Echeneis naucrates]|uniref:protein phosphatase 1 regulatory subunit 3F isoform X2 n=1 Tax=Echeneis naucrates TaxID=173247 RepID=UPI001113ECA8|nr:protein phosphatase 1 regulatory subunit 3F isoform X2 [Echeneis naucrates]